MPGVLLNGAKPDGTLRFRELAPEFQTKVGFKLAAESTKDNGLDEIFLEQNGKKYVLASDNLDLSELGAHPQIEMNGLPATVLHIDNESNSTLEFYKSTAGNALGAGISNGVGGMAAGIAVMLLERKISGKASSLMLGALAGFVSGFAWGAGSSITSDVKDHHAQDWASINDIVAEKDRMAPHPAILDY